MMKFSIPHQKKTDWRSVVLGTDATEDWDAWEGADPDVRTRRERVLNPVPVQGRWPHKPASMGGEVWVAVSIVLARLARSVAGVATGAFELGLEINRGKRGTEKITGTALAQMVLEVGAYLEEQGLAEHVEGNRGWRLTESGRRAVEMAREAR